MKNKVVSGLGIGVCLVCLFQTAVLGVGIGDTVKVTADLNVRTGPGTNYPEITDADYHDVATPGTVGKIVAGPQSGSGYTWWRVDFGPGQYSGWSIQNGLLVTSSAQPTGATATSVTLTLYVHEGSQIGQLIPGARVTGQDGAGKGFDQTTGDGGYVTIVGTSGNWKFTAAKASYQTNSWSQDILSTGPKQASLQAIPKAIPTQAVSQRPAPPTPTYPGSPSEPGQTIETLTPTLQWNGVPSADYYALAISEYPYGQGHIIHNPQQIRGTSYPLPGGVLQWSKKYRWNMQAHSPAGVLSDVSTTLYFQTKEYSLIITPPPPPPKTTTGTGKPVLIASLRIAPETSCKVGQTLTGEFTIRNAGDGPVTFEQLFIGGRYNNEFPASKYPDFDPRKSLTIQSGQSHQYQGTLRLDKPGNYHFFVSYQTKDGQWNTSVPTAAGVANTRDIVVAEAAQVAPPPTGQTNSSQQAGPQQNDNTVLIAAMEYIKPHEGYRDKAYKDSLGIWTVGWGLNLEDPTAYNQLRRAGAETTANLVKQRNFSQVTLDQDKANQLLSLMVLDCLNQARAIWRRVYSSQPTYADFDALPLDAKLVALDMIYQLANFEREHWYAFLPPFDETINPKTYGSSADRLETHPDLKKWRTQSGPNRVRDQVAKLRSLDKANPLVSISNGVEYTGPAHYKNAFDKAGLRGYCTWYAAERWLWDRDSIDRGGSVEFKPKTRVWDAKEELPSTGNANKWADDAKNKGLRVDAVKPVKGSIAVFGPTSNNSAGHVAYVESVDDKAGTFVISQMNAGSRLDPATLKTECFNKITMDSLKIGATTYKGMKVVGFIYPPDYLVSSTSGISGKTDPASDSTSGPGSLTEESYKERIRKRKQAFANPDSFPQPHVSLVVRMSKPALVERVENIHMAALDYQFLSLKCLSYAEDFLDKGDTSKTDKYIAKGDKYYNLAIALQRDSSAVLDDTYSSTQWTVVYEAAKTALKFPVVPLGPIASIIYDAGTLWTDYRLDSSTMPLEEAKRNLLINAISTVLLRDLKEAAGDTVKHAWGSSAIYPKLKEIMGSSRFRDAVLKEFMRLGGKAGDYVAEKAIDGVVNATMDTISSPDVGGENSLTASGRNINSVTKQAEGELSPDTPTKQKPPPVEKPDDGAKPGQLSPKEKAEAERLWKAVEKDKKLINAGWFVEFAKKRLVENCRQIIRKFPDSEYASKAKKSLADLPQKDRQRFGITDQEIQ